MSSNSQPLAYTSMIKFTVDGRPSVDDISQLFSSMMAQITPATHRYMFRSYTNTFSSEEAIRQLGSLKFSKRDDSSNFSSFTTIKFNMERGMAKALMQQFLWTRLIESATEPQNRTYHNKGIWRVNSKGLCVLQDFCEKTKVCLSTFKKHVTPKSIPMYLINLNRMEHNDRISRSRRYVSYLFTIMIASLPADGNRQDKQYEAYNLREFVQQDTSESSRASSIYSTDSLLSDSSDKWLDRDLIITDLFPDIGILPNNLLVNPTDGKDTYNHQHTSLIGKLDPSSLNKSKMRVIFSSLLCCNWLIEFCTVASTDEAENIMSKFLKLGWIKFLDSKYGDVQEVESSKTSILQLTKAGIKVIMGVSLNQYKAMNSPTDNARYSRRSSVNPSPCDVDKLNLDQCNKECTGLKPLAPSLPSPNKADYFTDSTPEKEFTDILTPPSTPTYFGSELKESNASKLKVVLKNPALRSLFHDFLSSNFCQENLDFWIDCDNLRRRCSNLAMLPSVNQRQLLEDVYLLWDSYLRPGATNELNVENVLREQMAEEISHIVTVLYNSGNSTPIIVVTTYSTYQSILLILNWFDKMNEHICRLMSSDSIPKFVKTSKYKNAIQQI